jgi:Ca-activated chloride channel family protein
LPVLRYLLIVALAAAAIVGTSAQEARLRITVPTEATYLAGNVRFLAVVEPASAAREVTQVTFFADGTQVCAVAAAPFECEWDSGERIRAHQIRAVAALKNGQRLVHTITTRDLEYVETVDVDVVQITAVVTDQRGQFVAGLTQKDFQVTEDGKPQKITSFSDARTPLELVTAIDVSSSVRDALPGMKAAAARFLGGLEAVDQVTLLGFNDNLFTLARRSTDQVVRERAIGRLAAWGGTALYDAIVQAVTVLGRQPGRRAIVLFTDGDDQSSHAPIDTAIARVEGSDAMIYAVGQGRAVNAKDLQRLLQRLATTSGGRAFFSNTPSKLDEVFAEILEDLHHQYVMAYPAPDNARNGRWHEVKVVAGGGKYRVRARQGYRLSPKS